MPSYLPERRQQRLKAVAGATRTQVVATKLFHELFFTVDHLRSALHFGFGRIAFSTLTAALESSVVR
jgi:hypothetical protein